MICGVKYCGGCNPRYNRTQFYEKLKGTCDSVEFQYVQPGVTYDHLLVICGCLSRCADISSIKVTGRTFKVYDEGLLEQTVADIQQLI